MSVVFINHPLETFTPTSSGALATIIWECCRVARSEGAQPKVITRSSAEAMFPWPNTAVLEYPTIPDNPLLIKALKAHRKLTGWNHLRHKAYALRVAEVIETLTDSDAALVLVNDPEMVVFLRSRFPERRIVHWFENQQPARSRVRRSYGKCADVTCGVSDFTSRWIAGYYSVPTVKTLYNGVDTEQFAPPASPAAGVPYVNFVGRTGIEKAPDIVLKAALKVTQSTAEFGVQLVGANHWDRLEMDDYQRELSSLSEALIGRGVDVRRPGRVSRADLPQAFHRAHIHVVPSRWDEPFGLTTVEGMASGLATIVSATGGSPEVVGDAGLLFERDNVDELAGYLHSFISNAAKRAEFGSRARERAMEFTWRRTWTELKAHAGV